MSGDNRCSPPTVAAKVAFEIITTVGLFIDIELGF